MANPFSGIISSSLKTLFSNAISALLYDDSCTIPCTISYGVTRYEDCPNCVASAIGGMPAHRYQDGGPIPFPFGSTCPMCSGAGKKAIETTESINLAVIWDYKQFIGVGTVNNPLGTIQIITFDTNTPKLARAKELIAASDTGYGTHRYERVSTPQPLGLGDTNFVTCLFERLS